MFPLGSLF